MYKNFHHTLKYVSTLSCEMQTFENGTNSVEITISGVLPC